MTFAALRQRPSTPVVPIERVLRSRERDWLRVASIPKVGKRLAGINEIIRAVSDYCKQPIDVLKSPTRTKAVCLSRQIAMYLCREHTFESWPAIGQKLYKDHTTVLHGHQKIARLILTNSEVAKTVSEIRRRLGVGE